MKLFSAIAILFTMVSAAGAWGFYDAMGDGSPIDGVTPVQSSMGGVRALPSGWGASIFLNPAELATLPAARINGSAALIQWRSNIFGVRDYDFLVTGNTGGMNLTAAVPLGDRLAIQAGITRVSDFGYNGVNNWTEPTPNGGWVVTMAQVLDSWGSLWEANAGVGIKLAPWLSAGVSGGLRFGKGSWTLVRDVVDPALPLPDTTIETSWEESAPCFHAGLLMPFSFGTFGVSATSSSDMYHSRLSTGFQRDLQQLWGGTAGMELQMQDLSAKNPALDGILFLRIPEMIKNVISTYNVGFKRATDYHHTALCMGTGSRILLGDIALDMSISWRSRSTSGIAVPEPGVCSIDDSGTYYSIGMDWEL